MTYPECGLSWSRFDEAQRPRHPIVFQLSPDQLPLLNSWTPDSLTNAIGTLPVDVAVSPDGHYRFFPNGARRGHHMMKSVLFADAAKFILGSAEKHPTYYVNAWGLDDRFRTLHDCIPYGKRTTALMPRLWFGSAGTFTELHFHWGDNVFCQVFGTKEFTIFAPSDSEHLYQFSDSCPMSHFSHVDVVDPNLHSYPAFAKATPITFVLRPGDVLFLPAGWWHHVHALSLSVSINQWWAHTTSNFWTPTGERMLRYHYALNNRDELQVEDMRRGILFTVDSINADEWASAAEAMMTSNLTAAVLVAEFARLKAATRRQAPEVWDPPRAWSALVERASQGHIVATAGEERDAQLFIAELRSRVESAYMET